MTTPSETRAGKLLRIVSEMRQYMSGRGNAPPPCIIDWSNRIEALAANEPEMGPELHVALAWLANEARERGAIGEAVAFQTCERILCARAFPQTAVVVPHCSVCLRSLESCAEPLCPGRLKNRLTPVAASEPVEAVPTCWIDRLELAEKLPLRGHALVGTKKLEGDVALYIHPTPEQPGKGEASRYPETQHERDCDYVTSDGPAPCTCKAARFQLRETPQPSDPAEGDAFPGETSLCDALQIAMQYVPIVGEDADKVHQLVAHWERVRLSTPPTAAVRVDDAMMEQFCAATYRPMHCDHDWARGYGVAPYCNKCGIDEKDATP